MKITYSYTNFLKSNIPITSTSLKQKNNSNSSLKHSITSEKNHINCDLCRKCHNYHKLLHTDKELLSEYIQTHTNYLKLIGNSRYKNKSPLKFVHDHNNKIINKIGLIPVPSKSGSKIKKNERKNLYELQRSIVMIRRFQYNKKNFFDENEYENYFLSLVIKIQLWWKKMCKIIKIQKIFKGWFIRNAYKSLIAFKILMDEFENVLNKILVRKCFGKIKNYFKFSDEFKNVNKGFFVSKKNLCLKKKIFENVIFLQKNLRKFFAEKKMKKMI